MSGVARGVLVAAFALCACSDEVDRIECSNSAECGRDEVCRQGVCVFGSQARDGGAADATLASTTLNWADGDVQPKSATLNLAADALDEDLELLMVRLVDPYGGADIAYPDTAQVTIADSDKAARLRS